MSGTRSPSPKAPATDGRTDTRVWRLGLMLWPFATGAVAINLFLLGLMGQALGLPALAPVDALIWSLPMGIPATWASALWVRSLIHQAEGVTTPPAPVRED